MVEKNKFKVGSLWKTRKGCTVEILRWDERYRVSFNIDTAAFRGHLEDGTCRGRPEDDLVEPWVKKRRGAFWVNVYPDADGLYYYATKKEADRYAGSDRIACKKVEWTEGEGL